MRSEIDPGAYFAVQSLGSFRVSGKCSTWNKSLFQKLKYGTGLSPIWASVFEKSMERLRILGGVPVFRRPSSRPISLKESDRLIEADSPERPPGCFALPTC